MEEKKEKKPTMRRDKLIELEQQAQKLWEEKEFFKCTPNPNKKKFFSTFPYPYMNGKLHLGHAFSLSKNEFINRYKKLQGFNLLFSQGFHCTGMPISAAAMRIKNELEQYGNPPVFPPLNEGTKEQRNLFQYEIMIRMGMTHEMVIEFVDPLKWLKYFPPLGKEDLKKFGLHADFRRSFITTSANPYYNAFIEWQFLRLKEQNKICFGKRPSIYSMVDKQICADHERAEGEGVNPQEYTLIKILIKDPLPEKIKDLAGKKVYLVAATLRPETMYGQTNCFLLPDGVYGAYEMKNKEIYICTERAAYNMAHQDMTAEFGKIFKIKDIEGKELLGAALKAPLTPLETVYALPMLTISMKKGTGVVTSVPTDAPDDFATLRDLQKKPELREKYGIKEHMVNVNPIEIIEIPGYGRNSAELVCNKFKVKSQNDKELLRQAKEEVYLEGFYKGTMVVKEYEGMKVQDAKPKVKKMMIDNNLADIYYEPESLVISRSRDECVVALCDQWYLNYADPEWKSLLYSHTKDRNKFWCFSKQSTNEINFTVNWLHEWGCSRNFGLGTKLPWDKKCLIESLSDSTIYMAYYTISYLLQGSVDGSTPGELNIKPEDIQPSDFDYIFLEKEYNKDSRIPEQSLKRMRDEFNYWYPMDLRCSGKDLIKNHLTMCLFNHCAIWKDYPEKWPKHFFCNGWILVNGDKMSKSKGNFYTIADACVQFGADATRIALAQAGDGLEDANFTIENAEVAILRLSTLEMYLREAFKRIEAYREPTTKVPESVAFFDQVFENSIKQNFSLTIDAYENMRFRDVIKYGFDEFQSMKDQYKINVGAAEIRKDLFLKYVELQLLIMEPIVPHFTEIIYNEVFYPVIKTTNPNIPQYISLHQMPTIEQKEIDVLLLMKYENLQNFLHEARLTQKKLVKHQKGGAKDKKDQPEQSQKLNVFVAKEYLPWQKKVLEILQQCQFEEDMKSTKDDWRKLLKANKEIKPEDLKKSFQFGQAVLDDLKNVGKQALQFSLPFSEIEFLEGQREYIIKELKIAELKFSAVEDIKAETKELSNILANAKPGKPGFQILI